MSAENRSARFPTRIKRGDRGRSAATGDPIEPQGGAIAPAALVDHGEPRSPRSTYKRRPPAADTFRRRTADSATAGKGAVSGSGNAPKKGAKNGVENAPENGAENSPKKAPHRRPKPVHYSEILKLRISKAQLEELDGLREAYAEATGRHMTNSSYVRELLTNGTAALESALAQTAAIGSSTNYSALDSATEALGAVANQTRMIGLNVNQIARATHSGATPVGLGEIAEALSGLQAAVDSVGAQLAQAGFGDGDEIAMLAQVYQANHFANRNSDSDGE